MNGLLLVVNVLAALFARRIIPLSVRCRYRAKYPPSYVPRDYLAEHLARHRYSEEEYWAEMRRLERALRGDEHVYE